MKDQSVHVVSNIGQCQFGLSTFQTDGADEQIKAVLLMRKNMFYPRADCGLFCIRPIHRLRHQFSLGFTPMDTTGQHLDSQPLLVTLGPVGAIGPDVRTGIILGNDVFDPGLRAMRPMSPHGLE